MSRKVLNERGYTDNTIMQHSWLTFAALAVALVHVVLHNRVAEAARVRGDTRHFML